MGPLSTLNLISGPVGTYIPKGARYAILGANGRMIYENADRKCEVRFKGFSGQFMELITMQNMAGPMGALPAGSIIFAENKWVKNHSDPDLDDTQDMRSLGTEKDIGDLSKIIENLRESIWDFEHTDGYRYNGNKKQRVDNMKDNLRRAKAELKMIKEKPPQKPKKKRETIDDDPMGLGGLYL